MGGRHIRSEAAATGIQGMSGRRGTTAGHRRRLSLATALMLPVLALSAPIVAMSGCGIQSAAPSDPFLDMAVTEFDRRVYSDLCDGQYGGDIEGREELPGRWDGADDYREYRVWWQQMQKQVRYAEIAVRHAGEREGGTWRAVSCELPYDAKLAATDREVATVVVRSEDGSREITVEIDPATHGCNITQGS